mgnify:CR=1 FL=1
MITGCSIWNHDTQKRIHHETLKVLKNVGVRVDNDETLEIFHSAGAHIIKEKKGGIVRLPEHLVEDCIGWAPKSVIYYGRDRARDYDTKSGKVGFSTYGECVQIADPYTRQLRPTTKEDCGNTGKLVDYFDELTVMERAVCSTDKPSETQPLHNLEVLLKNTSKHIILGAGNRENCKTMLKMARIAAGGKDAFNERPIITFSVCPSSPLTLTRHTCEVIIECAKAGVGLWLISMVLAGGTGPVTLAGSMVQHNAEILSGIVLAQLVKKGTPCTYCSSTSIMYLKNASSVMGAPEYGMMGRAAAQMAKFYDLPSAIATGVTESKSTDIQAAYETAINLTQVAMSRPPIIYGIGSIESGLTFDLAKVILDCEHIRHLLMAIDGIPVDEYQLAYEQIREVGPGGTYLLQKQTMDNMRKQSDVTVFDRNPRESWEKKGSPNALDAACQKAIDIIENHTPKALPDGAEKEIASLIREYEASILEKVA